jgi:hypothetical protein
VQRKPPHYGFYFNGARDAYVINEEDMCLVRRVFRVIGAERMPLSALKKVLDREGCRSAAEADSGHASS